jgi:hypothetical protein
MPTVASTASAEDVAGGGKLVLVAKNQGEALALRQEVKDRLVAMQHGQCPIL